MRMHLVEGVWCGHRYSDKLTSQRIPACLRRTSPLATVHWSCHARCLGRELRVRMWLGHCNQVYAYRHRCTRKDEQRERRPLRSSTSRPTRTSQSTSPHAHTYSTQAFADTALASSMSRKNFFLSNVHHCPALHIQVEKFWQRTEQDPTRMSDPWCFRRCSGWSSCSRSAVD